jgi:hypothetical protein
MKLSFELYSTIKKMHNKQKSLIEIASVLACSKDIVQEVILSQDFNDFTESQRRNRNSQEKRQNQDNRILAPRKKSIMKLRNEGETLASIGKTFNISRERVRQILSESGEVPNASQIKNQKIAKVLLEKRKETLELFEHLESNWESFRGKTIPEIAKMLNVSERRIKESISRVQLLYLIRNQESSIQQTWSKQDCIEILQLAATFSFPLTILEYRKLVDSGTIHGPTINIFISRFGSWMSACEIAGVETGEPQRLYNSTWSRYELLMFVRKFMHESQEKSWSIDRYQIWRSLQDPLAPSVGLLRLRLGTWTEIRVQALELETPDFDMSHYRTLESNEE